MSPHCAMPASATTLSYPHAAVVPTAHPSSVSHILGPRDRHPSPPITPVTSTSAGLACVATARIPVR
eukprot:4044036-Prymnesium_polylepis.1